MNTIAKYTANRRKTKRVPAIRSTRENGNPRAMLRDAPEIASEAAVEGSLGQLG